MSPELHRRVSAHYSSKIPALTGNKTVRDWLVGKTFQEQFEYGCRVIAEETDKLNKLFIPPGNNPLKIIKW